jgi:hypothetical protein
VRISTSTFAGVYVKDLDHPVQRIRALVRDEKLVWPRTVAQAEAIGDKAAPRTSLAMSFAFDLALEHEMLHGPPPGQTPWLLPLTSGNALQQLNERLQDLTAAIVRAHLSPTWLASQATTVAGIAAVGGVKASNKLFDRFHPRVLALPFLTNAFLAARGALPRTVAYELFTRPGLTGEDARTAYGAHKEPGKARAMVIGGLAATTGDTITPVSMFPVVQATWDDPDHPQFQARQETCSAVAALQPFGVQPAGPIAAFASQQFALLQQARAMLESAVQRGSRVCEDYGIDPQHVLDWAMPNRVVIGPLRLGASATNGMINHVLLLPGLDAELLRAADEHHVEVLAHAFDHMTENTSSLLPQLKKLAIADEDNFFHGPELTDILTGDGRWDLPKLDEISSSALDVIGTDDLAGYCGVNINSAAVRYFRVQQARLKAPDRGRLPVNLLVRVRPSDMVVWATTQPLTGPHANRPVLASELQLSTDTSITRCLDRFFKTFTPHKAQPSALTTRAYMNALIMIANHGTVAYIRSQQARQPRD